MKPLFFTWGPCKLSLRLYLYKRVLGGYGIWNVDRTEARPREGGGAGQRSPQGGGGGAGNPRGRTTQQQPLEVKIME